MAATAAERLFSLELLVDWVRLEAEPPPRAPVPAVAFRLLDFPPLLVLPPAAPRPGPLRGAIGFGRGKACLLRLRAAALRRPRLRVALLQLPARPAPARPPRLLGTCEVPLLCAARRDTFVLRGPGAERVGDVALYYRLTDLGRCLPGTPQLAAPLGPAAPEPPNADPPAPLRDRDEAIVVRSKAGPEDSDVAGSASSSQRSDSPLGSLDPEDAELDLETNTICPPPLFYTHLTQTKTPPARVDITIEPQRNGPEDADGVSMETPLVNPPTRARPPEHTQSATGEGPPVLVSPPHIQGTAAGTQSACHPQTEQKTIDTIRQLPLLNALLIELSLLYNQPVAGPIQVHPHLAWLYRTEPGAPESSAKSTAQAEPKKKRAVGELEKSLLCEKNRVDNHRKGKRFQEKDGGSPPQRVTKGKLLYGLTNTLRLRLKQTNPDMLIVHEKREQHRKTQLQTLGTKFRVPQCKDKLVSAEEESQKLQQPSKEKCSDINRSFAEDSDTSRQISGSFDGPSASTETKQRCATEQERVVCGENRTSNASLEAAASPANPVLPGRFGNTHILEGKLELNIQSPFVSQQEIVGKEGYGHERTTDRDSLTAEVSENRLSRNSCYESLSERKYSDDFTSSCYSEDFCFTEDTSRSLPAHDGSTRAETQKHSSRASKSSEARLSQRKNSSERSSVLSPPFSAGSPVLSCKRPHVLKSRDGEEASRTSSSDLSSSHGTIVKENQRDQANTCSSKVVKKGRDISINLTRVAGCMSSEKSQSPRTSQVSSYLPSNLSDLELKALESSMSDHFEEDSDGLGSLNISKQCKDICELVINKLPGYTV